jgi:hypothetical protein
MRIWRALKTLGCGALRDGAYLLPRTAAGPFDALAEETIAEGGVAWLLDIQAPTAEEDALLRGLFARNKDYAEFIDGLRETRKTLPALSPQEITRLLRKSGRDYDALRGIDYFPNESSLDAEVYWADFRAGAALAISPDEPHAAPGQVRKRNFDAYQGKLWATRRHLWIDRVASAWLIRRFIDRTARFLWLPQPADCPDDALGFDFDGAAFTHIGEMVTFEVLLASFGLDQDAGLSRVAAMVHALDVGGDPVPEAAGFEAIMAGMRQRVSGDDELLMEMSSALDALHTHFNEQNQKKN